MRLLVVEDEANIGSYLKAHLTAEGFDVDVATDGPKGLEMALTNRYDAITLDVMLPGMNGYRVCHEIRQAGLDTPILMLTARNDERDEAGALEIGADDFLSKPFSTVVLIARLRNLLRRKGQSRGQGQSYDRVLKVAGIEMDAGRRSVRRDGREIELTAREFALLEYLMRHEGEALSRADIVSHVWGPDFAGNDSVIESYIGYLRKKVDAPFGRKSIRTLPKFGYKIMDELA